MFSLTVYNFYGYHMGADLMRNDTILATAYSYNERHYQGSVTVVTECTAGELVWVKSIYSNNRVNGDSIRNYNILNRGTFATTLRSITIDILFR